MIKCLLSRPDLLSGPLKLKPKLILTQFQGLILSTPSLVILYFSLRRRPARGRDHRVGQHRPQVRPRPPAPGRELPQGVGRHRERVLPQQRVR